MRKKSNIDKFRAETQESRDKDSKKEMKCVISILNNETYQQQIQQNFRRPKTAELFRYLARYGSLTKDQIAALFRTTPSSTFCKSNLEELRDCGYLETHDRRSTGYVYRLSDEAFLDPETDRHKLSDADREALTVAITGIARSALPQKGKRHQRKAPIKKKRKKRMWGRSAKKQKLSWTSTATQDVFQNGDVLGKIAEYLDAKTILFSMVFVSRAVQPSLTHEHAVCCAMGNPKGRRRIQYLRELIQQGCIYTPSPTRILRLSIGKRCERCNYKKTHNLNDLGLFLCRSCTQGITTDVKNHSKETTSLLRIALDDRRCAKIVLSGRTSRRKKKTFRTLLYSGPTPFLDLGIEQSGPLLSVSNLTSPSPRTFNEIFAEIRAGDFHRNKIPIILEACKRFAPKYNHLGIIDHVAPYTNSNYSSNWKVLVSWENGECTWEPLTDFAQDDFETCLSYATEQNLLDTNGWRWLRK